ncbi:MAG: hypothetical protein ABIG96_04265 [Candidatus Micrarchaeota archaeon]
MRKLALFAAVVLIGFFVLAMGGGRANYIWNQTGEPSDGGSPVANLMGGSGETRYVKTIASDIGDPVAPVANFKDITDPVLSISSEGQGGKYAYFGGDTGCRTARFLINPGGRGIDSEKYAYFGAGGDCRMASFLHIIDRPAYFMWTEDQPVDEGKYAYFGGQGGTRYQSFLMNGGAREDYGDEDGGKYAYFGAGSTVLTSGEEDNGRYAYFWDIFGKADTSDLKIIF